MKRYFKFLPAALLAAMLGTTAQAGGVTDKEIVLGTHMDLSGPVAAGMGYLVGEKGPELFLPRQSGRIVPNGAMGGSTIVFNVSTPDANSFRASQGQMLAQAQQQIARAGRRNG